MVCKVFPILALSTFTAMLGVGIIGPLLPVYTESLGATGVVVGVVFASFSISRGIVMPIIGRASDRRGRKVFIGTGLLAYSLVSLGYVWAGSPEQLIVVRLVHGAASGMIIPVAQAYLGEIAPENEMGKWMGYLNAAFLTGFGFGPFIGGAVSDRFGMPAAYYLMGGLNMVAFLIAAVLLPEIRVPQKKSSPGFSFRAMSKSRVMKGVFSVRIMFDLGLAVVLTFLPIFAGSLGVSATETGVLLAISFLLMSSLQFVTGRLADRLDRRKLIKVGGIFMLVYLGLVPLASNFWQLLILAVLGGAACSLAWPAMAALAVQEGKRFGMGATIAAMFVAVSIGSVVGPIIGGVIVDGISIGSVFYFGGAMLLVGVGLFQHFTG